MGLSIGTVAGIMGITGFPVIVVYATAIVFVTYMYTMKFLQVDEQDYKEQEILMEGFGNSLGIFILSWILLYSFSWAFKDQMKRCIYL